MKQKTHSGTKKRTKISGRGKVSFGKAARNHLLSSKNPKQLKAGSGRVQAPRGHMKMISRLLNIAKKVRVSKSK